MKKLVAIVVLSMLAVISCAPATPPGGNSSTFKVSTSPNGLIPAFNPSITDYVTRCTPGSPTTVKIDVPIDTSVSVSGGPASATSFTTQVTRGTGQSFSIEVDETAGPTSAYYVRCLPDDFPQWTSHKTGATQAEYYVTVPTSLLGGKSYPTVFDTNGVPMWWGAAGDAVFAALLPNGNLAWTLEGPAIGAPSAGAEERALDGSLVRTITPTVGLTDIHDILLLPNGNYVIVAATVRTGVDLSMLCVGATCGPSSAAVQDQVIQEVTPQGELVWSWDAADHISPTEMDPQWFTDFILQSPAPYDIYHWNSIEHTGDGFVASFRHENAIYKIDRSTGDIAWKLGGTATPESLTILNDPVFPASGFGGQHDARVLDDGTLTLHDNGTGLGRPPRAVRYEVDTTIAPGTATLIEAVTDPTIPNSICCGSARKLPGGNWVMGWGGLNTAATEVTPDGTRVFDLSFNQPSVIYRSVPVLPGQLDRAALRAGMDAQYAP